MARSRDYIPRPDAGLLSFSANFSAKLSADPEAFGQTSSVATLVAEKHALFAARLTAALDPLTSGSHTRLLKNEARAELVRLLRQVAQAVTHHLATTDAQRDALGLPVRARSAAPRQAPERAPIVEVTAVAGTRVRLRLRDAEAPDSRTRPASADGATIFTHCGPAPLPPGDPGWRWARQTSRSLVDLTFPANVPSPRVWVTAMWYTETGLTSPATVPVSTLLQVELSGPALLRAA